MPAPTTPLDQRITETLPGLRAAFPAWTPPAAQAGKFDNREAWDNRKSFDNRPSWDNWNNRR